MTIPYQFRVQNHLHGSLKYGHRTLCLPKRNVEIVFLIAEKFVCFNNI